MKKVSFIALFLIILITPLPLFAQGNGNGFFQALHSNNIDTERPDEKIFRWDILGRFPVAKIYLFGYVNGNDTVYNTLAGISFGVGENFRFDVGAGAEFLETEQPFREIGPAFVFRGYAGDNKQKNTFFANIIAGTRVWWQAMYIHSFGWTAIGAIAEDQKGGGIRIEISPLSSSTTTGMGIFSNVFYNGEDPTKKINADVTIDVGVFFSF